MRRIQYHHYGGPEVMRLEDTDPPRPAEGEVLVRVRAAAVNAVDWKIRNGDMKLMTGRRFPRGMGHDFAGVVAAVGEGVTRFRVGDEVLGAAGMKTAGSFGELVTADHQAVAHKPTDLGFEQAATLPIVGVTALQALVNVGNLRSGHAVFIHGCLGGVGRAATQIALLHGASVAGSCRPTAATEAADLGIAPIVAFDVDPAPLAGRFDIVFDTAGTLTARAARTLLKPGGRIIDIVPTPTKFARSALPGPYTVFMGKTNPADLEQIALAAAHGTLQVPIALSVPLTEAIHALTELETLHRPRGGKVVVTID